MLATATKCLEGGGGNVREGEGRKEMCGASATFENCERGKKWNEKKTN